MSLQEIAGRLLYVIVGGMLMFFGVMNHVTHFKWLSNTFNSGVPFDTANDETTRMLLGAMTFFCVVVGLALFIVGMMNSNGGSDLAAAFDAAGEGLGGGNPLERKRYTGWFAEKPVSYSHDGVPRYR